MTWWRLILRSLRYHWQAQLAVAIGAAVAASILIGALVVGDSVTHSLTRMAMLRIGGVESALSSHDRFFTQSLAQRIETDLRTPVAPVLHRIGIAATGDGRARANGVQLHGVDASFWQLAPTPATIQPLTPGEVLINARLAEQLDVEPGDRIVIRIEKPGTLPRDMPLASDEDVTLALPVTVRDVVDDESFGRFGLQANQVVPFNAFVSLAWLQSQLDLTDRINLLLTSVSDADTANAAVRANWTLADAELSLGDDAELRSRRVFLDAPVVDAAATLERDATAGVLTYFVNSLEHGEAATPYSMVAAIGTLDAGELSPPFAELIPPDMRDDEIVINAWLADDQGAAAGDTITLRYFVIGEQRKLIEESATFTVRAVVPIEGPAADRTLMPDYPGIAEADHCRDWEPGTPIDLDRIRDKDEAYWDDHKGTPKAFVTLAVGRRMWANRFGDLTAIRFGDSTSFDAASTGRLLLQRIDPPALGLTFTNVREPALAASTQALDFGALFLSLSFFLIVAALLLTALLFAFGIEQRGESIGVMLAMGFRPRDVRRLLLAEGMTLSIAGAIVGIGAGLLYTRAVLAALGGVWNCAVGTSDIVFHVEPTTLLIGLVASVLVSTLAMLWTLRRQARQPVRQLLAPGSTHMPITATRSPFAFIVAAVCIIAAGAIVLFAPTSTAQQAAGAFFGSGALLLIAGLAASRAVLTNRARLRDRVHLSVAAVGVRSAGRRRGRSLATVTLLACGVFLLIAVSAFHQRPVDDPTVRSSGTGGFTLLGEAQLPLLHDLAETRAQEELGLDAGELAGVSFVPMRLREGDDASCLNLNRAQQPRLLGVAPELLRERGAFRFTRLHESVASQGATGWDALDVELEPDVIPAVADSATVQWALQTKVGAEIEYIDERGQPFRVRIVATIADSILQGHLILAEDDLLARFPSVTGYRTLLIDAPPARMRDVAETLSFALEDVGLQVSGTRDRLAQFSAVNNTYLAIFQALGALGLVLGSVGLGIVVMRNVLERRQELAMLRAVGYKRRTLRWMVFSEHALLLALGLAVGLIAAAVAVTPALDAARNALPTTSLAVAAVLLTGGAWAYLATHLAIRGSLRAALQAE